MNSRRTRLGCAFFALLLGALVLAVGFNVRHYWTYGGQTSAEVAAGVYLTTWVDTQIQHSGVMGIDLMTTSRLPFSIRFIFSTADTNIYCVVLNHVALTNELTGVVTVVDGTSPRSWDFSEREYSNWISGKLEHHEVWRCTGYVSNCIARPEPFFLECRGYLKDRSGGEIPFSYGGHFAPRKESGLRRGWVYSRPINPPP